MRSPATDRWFLVALVTMLVNDHVLKPWLGSGPLGLITGKISDFTAPLIGSVLIALVLSSPGFRRIPLAVRNRIALVIPALTPSHRIVVEPTDLVGLAVLPVRPSSAG